MSWVQQCQQTSAVLTSSQFSVLYQIVSCPSCSGSAQCWQLCFNFHNNSHCQGFTELAYTSDQRNHKLWHYTYAAANTLYQFLLAVLHDVCLGVDDHQVCAVCYIVTWGYDFSFLLLTWKLCQEWFWWHCDIDSIVVVFIVIIEHYLQHRRESVICTYNLENWK